MPPWAVASFNIKVVIGLAVDVALSEARDIVWHWLAGIHDKTRPVAVALSAVASGGRATL